MNVWEFISGNPWMTIVLCITVCAIVEHVCDCVRRIKSNSKEG